MKRCVEYRGDRVVRVKENYILRQVADTWVVFPLGKANLDFNGMLQLNESGAFLWHHMEKGVTQEELADLLIMEYDISKDEALADIDSFVDSLRPVGCIEE